MNDTAIEEVTQDSEATADPVEATSAPVDPNSKQNVISAVNPTSEEMESLRDHIATTYDFNVSVKPVNFNFKKSTDKITGIETIRESVQLAIPYPTMDGIIAILEEQGKGLELLFECMETVVNTAARDLIAEDTSLNAATFPVDKVSWEAIANLPKAQRRGGGIPKETWEAFAQDYVEVMPEVTGKTIEQVANAAKILANKLTAVRTSQPVLEMLVGQLGVYLENSPNAEEYKECVEFLLNKADTFLNVSDEELLANL
jgi:hypothetical protein